MPIHYFFKGLFNNAHVSFVCFRFTRRWATLAHTQARTHHYPRPAGLPTTTYFYDLTRAPIEQLRGLLSISLRMRLQPAAAGPLCTTRTG
jgi:hypothetical protein